jgi:DNA-binding transcriptional LysR family regulator
MADSFDLECLKTFVAVVDAGGFTRASEQLFRTQPAISLRMKRLEELVGTTLFERKSRKILLTADGKLLLEYARRIVALAEEAFVTVAEASIQGVVRLGTPSDFAATFLPKLLALYSRSYPKVQLEVRCDSSPNLKTARSDKDLDIILAKRHPGSDDGVPVWREALVWASGPEFQLRDDVPMPLIVFSRGCLYREQVVQRLAASDRPWRVTYTSPNPAGVWAAVEAGLGVAALPRKTLPPGFKVWSEADGLPTLPEIELALYSSRPELPLAGQRLHEHILGSFRNLAELVTGGVHPAVATDP